MKSIPFNTQWSFYKSNQENTVTTVDLPHDAQISEERTATNPVDNGYFPGGSYVYFKKTHFSDDYKNQEILLEFDGVYMNCEVFINDTLVATQPYGYSRFTVPIHDHIVLNSDNEIKVIADNSLTPNARWYTGSGIYRTVNLLLGPKNPISSDDIAITTLSYNPPIISLTINHEENKAYTVVTNIYDKDQLVESVEGFKNTVTIKNAKLWSAQDPNLYTAHVKLYLDGQGIDTLEQDFGIRLIEWDASYGLKINGEEVLLRGGCVHHDNGLLGAAAYPETEARKVQILKAAGFNAIRSAHNMCSKALLNACDRYGMYMMDEFSDMWTQHKHKYDYATHFRDWYEKDLRSLVKKDYNHPSVILYSIGNEVGESATPEGLVYAAKMTDLLHELDQSRPVTCGINLFLNGLTSMGKGLYQGDGMAVEKDKDQASGSTFINGVMSKMGPVLNYVGRLKKFDEATRDVFELLDIAGYNYGSGRYKVDPKDYPKRITVGSETYPPSIYKNWQAVKKYPNLIGDFMWTAWDYLGESGIGIVGYGNDSGILKPFPALMAGCGVIEITGELRPEAYLNQLVWNLRTKPYIGVEPLTYSGKKMNPSMWRTTNARHSWSWQNCQGKTTNIIVYATGKTVALYVNNTLIGKRRIKGHKALFKKVLYTPGELKAIAYDAHGRIIGEDLLNSASTALQVDIVPEEVTFTPGELLYVNLYLVDQKGEREFGMDMRVSIALVGAELIGYGSANPAPTNNYQSNVTTTYNGSAQLILKAHNDVDTIRITASTDTLPTTEIDVGKGMVH